MRFIDNSPVYESSVGVMIEEECSVGQFLDSCIYIIAGEGSPLAQKAFEVEEGMRNWRGDYFNTYDLEVIPCVELANHPKIRKQVEEQGCNLLMQLYTPGEDGKRFIAAKTDVGRLYGDVGLVTHDAERIYQYCIVEALKRYSISNPGEFEELAAPLVSNKRFISDYLSNQLDKVVHPTFGMTAPSLGESLGVGRILTHKKRLKCYNELSNNIRDIHKLDKPETMEMLNIVFGPIMEASTMRYWFSKIPPMAREKFLAAINPQRMAEESSMDLEIRRFAKIDAKYRNDGIYRLIKMMEGKLSTTW